MNDCWVAMFIYAVVYIVCMLVFFMECFRNENGVVSSTVENHLAVSGRRRNVELPCDPAA